MHIPEGRVQKRWPPTRGGPAIPPDAGIIMTCEVRILEAKPVALLPNTPTPSKRRADGLWILPPMVLVLITYLWFISAGLWTTWPKTAVYDYYSSLAAAFQNGQLYLQDPPSPQLLALPDPYRIGARKGIPHLWDATLYKDRYYLYWGPVPALLLLPVRVLSGSRPVPDLYLAFSFVAGAYAVLCLILVRAWKRFYGTLSAWPLSLTLAVAGLAPPLTWMLNRPEVYEAAIGAGQFFVLLGLYLCFRALDGGSRNGTSLALASACLGLALGSRTSQALPAVFVIFTTSLALAIESRRRHLASWPWKSWLMLVLPAASAVAGLLWYNWARFGSIAEFGYRYQLTLLQLPKHYDEVFSTVYILPNLYNYFLNPFTMAADFPPIRPQYGSTELWPTLNLPRIYFSEAVTGLAFTFPFMVLAVFALSGARRSAPSRSQPSAEARKSRLLTWLGATTLGLSLVELATLLVFFFATERYLAELVPSLTLASSIGFWQAYKSVERHAIRRRGLGILAIGLALASIVPSSLLAVSSYQERMRTFNPALLSALSSLFQR